jgi:hypothetical protein
MSHPNNKKNTSKELNKFAKMDTLRNPPKPKCLKSSVLTAQTYMFATPPLLHRRAPVGAKAKL